MRHVDSELRSIIREMEPELNPGVYVYSAAPAGAELGGIDAIALIREREGWTVVAEEAEIRRAGLPVLFRAAWITLSVTSDLHAVGFTAAFSRALARRAHRLQRNRGRPARPHLRPVRPRRARVGTAARAPAQRLTATRQC